MSSVGGSFFSGTNLSLIFLTAALDAGLFAWMHFTPEGLAFGADLANTLGFTEGVETAAGLTSAVTESGAEVLLF